MTSNLGNCVIPKNHHSIHGKYRFQFGEVPTSIAIINDLEDFTDPHDSGKSNLISKNESSIQGELLLQWEEGLDSIGSSNDLTENRGQRDLDQYNPVSYKQPTIQRQNFPIDDMSDWFATIAHYDHVTNGRYPHFHICREAFIPQNQSSIQGEVVHVELIPNSNVTIDDGTEDGDRHYNLDQNTLKSQKQSSMQGKQVLQLPLIPEIVPFAESQLISQDEYEEAPNLATPLHAPVDARDQYPFQGTVPISYVASPSASDQELLMDTNLQDLQNPQGNDDGVEDDELTLNLKSLDIDGRNLQDLQKPEGNDDGVEDDELTLSFNFLDIDDISFSRLDTILEYDGREIDVEIGVEADINEENSLSNMTNEDSRCSESSRSNNGSEHYDGSVEGDGNHGNRDSGSGGINFIPEHEICDSDVKMGKAGYRSHPGNIDYRILITDYSNKYNTSDKCHQTEISREILQVIADRGGRFLEKWKEEKWLVADCAKAREKVTSNLRDRRKARRKGNNHKRKQETSEPKSKRQKTKTFDSP